MRLLLALLAIANLRWANAAHHRARRLFEQGDAVLAEAERHLRVAHELADRTDLSRR